MRCEGKGLLALWNDTDPSKDDEYNDWHVNEHVPERLTVPGMLNAYRYFNAGNVRYPYFTLYEMQSLEALETPEYKRLLAEPTPWSRRMRQYFKNIRRIVCKGECAASGSNDCAKDIIVLTVSKAELDGTTLIDLFQDRLRTSAHSWRLAVEDSSASALPWVQDDQKATAEHLLLLITCDHAEAFIPIIEAVLRKQNIKSTTLECYEFQNQFKTKTNN
ncbi:MAG: hypothetical protein VX148_08810 [Pseudomonadota bacterium]|nr:hypothetical protein [Pseudomonadota bacterium]